MFTLSQREDCPLIPPEGLQTPPSRLKSPHSSYSPNVPASVGLSSANPAGPLSLVCIPLHMGQANHQTTHHLSSHTKISTSFFLGRDTFFANRAQLVHFIVIASMESARKRCVFFLTFSDPNMTISQIYCSAILLKKLACLQIYDAWEIAPKYL